MANKSKHRIETDALGDVKIPIDSYYGSTTARALKNFQISDVKAHKAFRQALGIVKLSAAKTNYSLGLIPRDYKDALLQACKEFMDGNFDDEFTLDAFQAGAGTSYNMNANEVIANRANEILKGKKGEYEFIHPNNHVNLAQSTNDVIPTATGIAVLLMLPDLLKEISLLEEAFEKKAKENKDVIKVGRTHLQDAVPITVGQELDSFKEAIRNSREFIETTSKILTSLNIGGTALGTGINTDPQYRQLMVLNLSKLTGIRFKSCRNLTEGTNNMAALMNFSATLRSLATDYLNITKNLKFLSSGPIGGLAEYTLPAVQPGSSIMPGKINPSIPETIEMISFQVCGNDRTIELGAQRSTLELNVMCPVIMYNLLESMQILTSGTRTFRTLCIKGLKVNKKRINFWLENSLINATALVPYIGYNETSEVVKAALKKGITIREEVLERDILSKKAVDEILSANQTTKPSRVIKKYVKKG